MSDSLLPSSYCPYCQMPLSLVRKNHVNLHVEVCVKKHSRQKMLNECPKGEKCNSTMICHYERYSHNLLAEARAKGENKEPMIAPFSPLSSVLTQHSQSDTDGSMDDFVNLSPMSKMRRRSKKMLKRKMSPSVKVKSTPATKDRLPQRNLKSQLTTRFNKNTPPQCGGRKRVQSMDVDTSPVVVKVESLCSSTCVDMTDDFKDVMDNAKSPKSYLEEVEFIAEFSKRTNTEGVVSEPPLIGIETTPRKKSSSVCEMRFNEDRELQFDDKAFTATSTQVARKDLDELVTDSDTDSDSLLKSSFEDFNKSNSSTVLNSNTNCMPNPLKKPPVTKKKQADIGAMLFGLKPIQKIQPSESELINDPAQFSNYNKRQCPFYKKVAGTNIAVDAFSYGLIPGIKFYFLSHFHYDHYMGLSKKFESDIYCSNVTGNLVEARLKLSANQIKRLPMNKSVNIGNVKVTLLEANHCPGAVLILFKLANGKTVLHTGDFRADLHLQKNPTLHEHHINTLYLDTTYLDPNYDFPPQNEVVEFASRKVYDIVRNKPRTLVVTGTYCIGKEKIFLSIAEKLGCAVFVSGDKEKTLKCLDDRKVDEKLTRDPNQTNIHVIPMKQLALKNLNDYLKKFASKYEQIVAVKPTGWTYKGKSTDLNNILPSRHGSVIMLEVPYSEHSSFLELKQFVEMLKPDRIIPTVNVGRTEARKLMESYLSRWKM